MTLQFGWHTPVILWSKLPPPPGLQILETVIMSSVTYGMETWTNLSKKDKEEIEKIHKELITSLFELAKSTPYWGIIDILAIQQRSLDRALFLYIFIHGIRSSGIRASITIVYIRKFYEMQQSIVRLRFFFKIAKRSIAETAIWPILQTIDYQKFMLLHNMLNSEDTKVSKKVLLSQARNIQTVVIVRYCRQLMNINWT